MSDCEDFYGSEEQNTDMELINSRIWPSEPQTRMETEDYIEKYAALVNKLRREIEQLTLQGKDVGELIYELTKAEQELDKWIDIRVESRELKGKELPF